MLIEFDKTTHSYKIDKVRVPSVSAILRGAGLVDFSGIDSTVLARASNFGTACHKMCELSDKKDLDESVLSEHLVPYLLAWRNFMEHTGFKVLESETPVGSKKWGYAGTPDRVGTIKGQLTIVDLKTNAVMRPECALQIAGYKIAYEEMRGEKVKKRIAVHLKPDGKYALHCYTDQMDEPVFLSAVNIFKWKNKGVKH